MANCAENVYVIKYTDTAKGTITITKSSLVTNLVDIALVGKSRLDYGEVFNENLLHLLENFACPEDSGEPGTPDLTVAFGSLLGNPIEGQKWFNSTDKRLYLYVDGTWVKQASANDVAANSGVIAHGNYLPRPVNNGGYVFPYAECSFVVSPHSHLATNPTGLPTDTEVDYLVCYVNSTGLVTMQFRYRGESSMRNGYANYQIIGIRGESNGAVMVVTPYPVPSPTPGVSATVTPTPTPTPGITPSMTRTPTPTPVASVGVTPTRTVTPTPTITVTRTHTPTPTPTKTVTPTPSASPAAAMTLGTIPSDMSAAGGGAANISFEMFSDGTWFCDKHPGTDLSGVYLPSGNTSQYEFNITFSGPNAADFNTTYLPSSWYGMDGGLSLALADADPDYEAVVSCSLTVRKISNHAVSQTSNFTLSADGGCFAVGTQLATPAGLVNVEDLNVGDIVSSFDLPNMVDESEPNWLEWNTASLAGLTIGTSTVTHKHVFTSEKGISINGVKTTREHIYFTFDGENYGWKNASDVLLIDKLVTNNGELIDIIDITVIDEPVSYVALGVETDDTLIASYNGILILSHNISG